MEESRIARLQSCLASDEALLVTTASNRFYLTGCKTSAGAVLVLPDAGYFLVDFRYFEMAKKTVTACEVALSASEEADVRDRLTKRGIRRLYIETEGVSVRQLSAYRAAWSGVEVLTDPAMDDRLQQLRQVKSAEELGHIRRAQAITDETFTYLLSRLGPGRTEREVMLELEFYMRRLGSEGVAFDSIVVAGAHSSLPHGVPGDRVIERGDLVTMDFGARCGGYCADMTRTVAIGTVSDDQREIYRLVWEAQQAAIAAIRPGAVCREVDRVARDKIAAAGYGDCFGHGLGHSVGIDIHEQPCCNRRCDTVLQAGVVMTVEPGVYLEDRFGVRIEDMVVVTADGCDDLTASPSQLIVL